MLVALTGWGQEEDRRRSEEAGFDAHMVKPVDLAALFKPAGPVGCRLKTLHLTRSTLRGVRRKGQPPGAAIGWRPT